MGKNQVYDRWRFEMDKELSGRFLFNVMAATFLWVWAVLLVVVGGVCGWLSLMLLLGFGVL